MVGKRNRKEEIDMFDRFGEFDSYKELNETAEGLFNEGDMANIKVLAQENGIPEDYVTMYLEGEIMELTDASTAAVGKIDIEAEELDLKTIMIDWKDYIQSQAMENEMMAHQIRKKGKTLKGCIAALLKWSFKNQVPVPNKILKEAGVKAGKVTLGIPGMAEAKQIIRTYYMGK